MPRKSILTRNVRRVDPKYLRELRNMSADEIGHFLFNLAPDVAKREGIVYNQETLARMVIGQRGIPSGRYNSRRNSGSDF